MAYDRRLERQVGRIEAVSIGCEDAPLHLQVAFTYGGSGQSLLGPVDGDFIKRIMRVFQVNNFNKLKGHSCWVTHYDSGITKLEPLIPGEGEEFDIDKWHQERKKEKA